MNEQEKIQEAYASSKTYPELAKKLAANGVQSYTVEVSTGITLFRFAEGKHLLQRNHVTDRAINNSFDREATIQAVRNSQQGKTTYPQFMDEIAGAGVKFYEATLNGQKRVTYIGNTGEYEEEIPG